MYIHFLYHLQLFQFFKIPDVDVDLDLDFLHGMDSMLHKRISFQYSTKENNTEIRVNKDL